MVCYVTIFGNYDIFIGFKLTYLECGTIIASIAFFTEFPALRGREFITPPFKVHSTVSAHWLQFYFVFAFSARFYSVNYLHPV